MRQQIELTKESLKEFLDTHPAISMRGLAIEANVSENAIRSLYNKMDRSLTSGLKEKLIPVLKNYGSKFI